MLAYVTAAILIAVSAVVLLFRRPLAKWQALIIGLRILPGCIVAEVIALLVLAAAIVFAHVNGLV